MRATALESRALLASSSKSSEPMVTLDVDDEIDHGSWRTRDRCNTMTMRTIVVALVVCCITTRDMARHVRSIDAHVSPPPSVTRSRLGIARMAREVVMRSNALRTRRRRPSETTWASITTPELAFAVNDGETVGALNTTQGSRLEGEFPRFEATRYRDSEGSTRRALETPVYVIALKNNDKDQAKARYLKKVFERDYGVDAADAMVTIEDAVNAAGWPETIELADRAVAPLEEKIPLKALYYLNALDQARKSGTKKLPKSWRGIAHHVGCLFSHLRMWQLHAEKGNAWSIIFESDGLYFLAVAPRELQSVVDNAPPRADVIFFHKKDVHTGQFVKQIALGRSGEMIYMYAWDKLQAGAGLSGYMIGPRFTSKINDIIVGWRGADMVDAWLMLKTCAKKDAGEYGDVHRLNCYHAQRGPKPAHLVGGYLPQWYGIDKTNSRWTDNWPEFLANERNDTSYRIHLREREKARADAESAKRAATLGT